MIAFKPFFAPATGEDPMGYPSRGRVIWYPAMELCAIVCSEDICLEVPRFDTDATKPRQFELSMKALGDL